MSTQPQTGGASTNPGANLGTDVPTLGNNLTPYDTAPASSHSHRNRSRSRRNQSPNSVVLRIQHELNTFIKEPVPFLYIHVDDSDVTRVSAIIVGPLDTPYAGGIFRFDMHFGPAYPMRPPTVTFLTTSGGRVRFNPNLYANGHVCLSILGTWAGPAWSSAESLTSVLLSIQSIMCPQPYHNEPGFEKKGDEATIKSYNDYIRLETLRVGVIESFNAITISEKFPGVCERLFLMWYDMYVSMAKDLKERREGEKIRDAFSTRTATFQMQPIIDRLAEVKKAILNKLENIDNLTSDPDSDESDDSSTPNEGPRTNSAVIDRLLDEAEILSRNPPHGSSASPRNRRYPFIWDATIFGPENSCWEGGLFTLEMRFSSRHPEVAPFVKFTSKVFHPNITSDGIPAIDMIQTRWNSTTKIGSILEEIQKLLATPNAVYPVNLEASKLFQENKSDYESKVRRMAQNSC